MIKMQKLQIKHGNQRRPDRNPNPTGQPTTIIQNWRKLKPATQHSHAHEVNLPSARPEPEEFTNLHCALPLTAALLTKGVRKSSMGIGFS